MRRFYSVLAILGLTASVSAQAFTANCWTVGLAPDDVDNSLVFDEIQISQFKKGGEKYWRFNVYVSKSDNYDNRVEEFAWVGAAKKLRIQPQFRLRQKTAPMLRLNIPGRLDIQMSRVVPHPHPEMGFKDPVSQGTLVYKYTSEGKTYTYSGQAYCEHGDE